MLEKNDKEKATKGECVKCEIWESPSKDWRMGVV